MSNDLLMGALSPRELLFLGGGAAALAVAAVLMHARANVASARVRGVMGSLAAALFVSGAVLAHAGF